MSTSKTPENLAAALLASLQEVCVQPVKESRKEPPDDH